RPAPTATPKPDEKKPGGINLGGLPDMPAFDGISGGAKPPSSPVNPATPAAGAASGPAFDSHHQPTRMDFQAVQDTNAAFTPSNTPAAPSTGSGDTPSGVGSLLEGLPQSDSFGGTPSPDNKPAAPAAAPGAGANGVLYAQDFSGVNGSPVPGWEG